MSAPAVEVCTRRADAIFTTCKCTPCRERRARVQKVVDVYGPQSHRVPSEAAWKRIEALLDRGWSAPAIATASGIRGRYVEQIISRWRTTGTQTRIGPIRAGVLAALPLVDPPGKVPGRIAPRVPALGTQRRLRALATMGWPISAVAERAGLEDHAAGLRYIRQGKWQRCPEGWAIAVAKAYREMVRLPPPSSRSASYSRNKALSLGWLGPASWHDPDTDPAPVR